ncbi:MULTISPECIES: hypothetical protein [unclassified Micromonospora]|uniref:hypothetical protein n=1 Tax=unclassified Micromonospora TaxID=2617518 RepID=UPI001C20F6C4|nr:MULTISPECIES: hypothetical protein [unclassified Micromonospora]MBU8858266.1 hypothetical protein [Micromonospora sp. WMMB482]MDM4783909.1 hypothetical protein [Micromonospora sp. b486]
MPEKELTLVDRCILVTLMVKAAPLPQTYFKNVAGISLKPEHRSRLKSLGLIEVTEKPRIVLALTDEGWDRATEELGAEPPKRAGAAGGTLYVALDFLRRLIDHSGTRADDLFRMQINRDDVVAPAVASSASPAGDAVALIRQAYHELAARPGDYVMLADLRDALSELSRPEFDAALVTLNQERGVYLVPESNQKALRLRERAAAATIGNQDKHLLAISS